ncbi:MAG: DEAD/DEAH box helicase [Gammaproteobacteria bacterium]|nr:DEAD/DEAH box helicase [Gammaproteobacteria bacterium]MBT8150724.1 DEAD/DEAH box helicase [Gammaproteobacteria bacterium]NND40150.1 DEAD/DEAH box helicase [Pseudomonadales bacterium]NNM12172.1 DEAD/DEAH box helicase [Pseudomonadales bacterium]
MLFTDLGLSKPLLKAIADKGYGQPSAIQAEAIPVVLERRDVMAAAQTGTGKTAGFTLPILELLSGGNKVRGNQVRALVLTPTRELAAQVHQSALDYGKYLKLRSSVVFGGVKINPQMMRLRGGTDILIATPGRLLDLYQQNALKFEQLEVLVLDEADRMLDMGFINDIRKIIALLPKKRQTLMFSATFSTEIRQLARGIVHKPAEISVSPANQAAPSVEQRVYPVDSKRKAPLLIQLIRDEQWHQALVFTKTKRGANKLAQDLTANGIEAAAIHGNKSQGARTSALREFKAGKTQILVATDIAARGLDIDQLPQVVNFDLPQIAEDYVHRIGRTGRAGATGKAVSLVSAEEFPLLVEIEHLIKQLLPREILAGFEPQSVLPNSRPGQRANAADLRAARNNGGRGNGARGRGGRNNSAAGSQSGNRKADSQRGSDTTAKQRKPRRPRKSTAEAGQQRAGPGRRARGRAS